ncbi:MAG: glycosyltransferase, partial [Clostridiales Family XIII bacterium]|nr:glycosyltransferase [Clostridiales Family XIII bacterium]
MEAGQDMGSPAPYTISIVIPVHNVAAYLNACVDSIASQAAKRTEIILVDDGSTDASPGICDDYALAFQNISVIHKENGGLSDARNAGVRAASGEWLLFVDGDDWIEENSLAEIERAAARACPEDLIFLQMSKVFPDGKKTDVGSMPDRGKLKGAPKAAALDHLASLPKFPGSACAKLIRRSVLTQNNIRFQEGLL